MIIYVLNFSEIVVEVGIVGEVSRRCNNRQWYIKQEAMQDAMRCKTSGALLSESSVVQAICPQTSQYFVTTSDSCQVV